MRSSSTTSPPPTNRGRRPPRKDGRRHARHAARGGRQSLHKQRRRGESGSHRRRSGTLREPVRGVERGRKAARTLPWLGGLPERRAGQHWYGRHSVAHRGREAGGGGG